MKTPLAFLIPAVLFAGCRTGVIRIVDPFQNIQPRNNLNDQNAGINDTVNDLYKIGNKYTYEYLFTRNDSSFLFTSVTEPGTGLKKWKPVLRDNPDKNAIASICLEITEPQRLNATVAYEVNQHLAGQTLIRYSYFSSDGRELSYEVTGLVENAGIVFFHPPRLGYFKILELNPFPYMLTGSRSGDRWAWQLNAVGDAMFGDAQWKTWNGLIDIDEVYKNGGKRNVYCKVLKKFIRCTKIKAEANSTLGRTGLIAYFNEQLGFVRLEFHNINQSKLILTLTDIPHRL